MIDGVRQVVHDFLEKNNKGWLKPERFNNYAYLAQMEIFESYAYDFARWVDAQTNRKSGSGYADIPANIKEKLDRFYKIDLATYSAVTKKFTPPADCYRVLDIFYDGQDVSEVTQRRLILLNRSNLTSPSEEYPVYVRTESGVSIYPETIIDEVTVSYIRKPKDPVWSYRVFNGNPLFDPSDSDYQDFEIHPADEPRLIVKILEYAGVSIREGEIIQYAEAQEMEKKSNESRQ